MGHNQGTCALNNTRTSHVSLDLEFLALKCPELLVNLIYTINWWNLVFHQSSKSISTFAVRHVDVSEICTGRQTIVRISETPLYEEENKISRFYDKCHGNNISRLVRFASGSREDRVRFASDLRRHRVRLATASCQNPNKFMTNGGPLIKLVTNFKHEEAQ